MNLSHKPTMEFDEVIDNLFLGSAICCPEHEDFFWKKLKELDIFCDIDLREEIDADPEGIPVYLNIPTRDTFPITAEQVQVAAEVIDKVLKMGKRVYVHCQYGQGRSPTLVMAYLMIKNGVSLDEAYKLVKNKHASSDPTDKQIQFLKALEESL